MLYISFLQSINGKIKPNYCCMCSIIHRVSVHIKVDIKIIMRVIIEIRRKHNMKIARNVRINCLIFFFLLPIHSKYFLTHHSYSIRKLNKFFSVKCHIKYLKFFIFIQLSLQCDLLEFIISCYI